MLQLYRRRCAARNLAARAAGRRDEDRRSARARDGLTNGRTKTGSLARALRLARLDAARARGRAVRSPELAPPRPADHHVELSVRAVSDALAQFEVVAAVEIGRASCRERV